MKLGWKKLKSILNRILISNNSDCWPWQGRTNKNGYASVRVGGPLTLVHRIMWCLHNHKEVPIGMEICHECDNPTCCNPNHLVPKTHVQNMGDMVTRGRSARLAGEKNPNSRLTIEQIRWCRKFIANGGNRREAAKILGINPSHVDRIVTGRSWSHI